MLSDHAGGARLGRELLEETLLALDGMAERTALVDAVLARFNGELRQIIAFSRKATAADYAAFAPLVFNHAHAGDPLGNSILQHACSYIARGLERLDTEALGRFSLTGGLASSYAALPFLPYRGTIGLHLATHCKAHYRSLCWRIRTINRRYMSPRI